ncbi:MAG: low affinity iron permease family protein [Blastocatellia bacterium]
MKGEQPKAEGNGFAEFFTSFASRTAQMVGSYWAFLLSFLVVIVWALTGPMFHYSDTWQLVINTGTTIITFLMVFLIQNTQNRDAKAMHLKLNELITAVKAAHNEMIDIEKLSDKQLEEIADIYRKKKEECGNDAVTAIASEVAVRAAHDTAHRVAGDTAKKVADDTAKKVADDTARRVVEDDKRRVA